MDDLGDDDTQGLFGIDALEAGALAAIFGPSPPAAPRRDQAPSPLGVDSNSVKAEVVQPNLGAIHGQDHVKQRAQVHIQAARNRGGRPGNILVGAHRPGLGVSHVARLIAAEIDTRVWTVTPADSLEKLQATVASVPLDGVILVDDVDRFARPDAPGVFGESVVRTGTGPTVVGATSDITAIERVATNAFDLILELDEYSDWELALVAAGGTGRYMLGLHEDTLVKIGQVADTPRDVERFILAARDLRDTSEEPPPFEQIADLLGVDSDGLDRRHREYLDCLFNQFARRGQKGTLYQATEAALQTRLGQTPRTLRDIETPLLRQDFIAIEAEGRRLTGKGIRRARQIGNNSTSTTAANGVEHDFYDPDPGISRDIYLPYICRTCGIERDIIDFYDGQHSVHMAENATSTYFVIDHGELAQRDE